MGPEPALLQENRPHIEFLETGVLVRPIKGRLHLTGFAYISATKTVSLRWDILLPSLENRIARIKSAITFSLHPKHPPHPNPRLALPPNPFTCPVLF